MIGKVFEAEFGRGWGAKTGWRWEEEDATAGEWEPIRAVKAHLRDLDRRCQDQATNVLNKVKLSLVSCLHTPASASVVCVCLPKTNSNTASYVRLYFGRFQF
jgi:digalactosyldiacylglycerol synthase